jgi:hypothetical protein
MLRSAFITEGREPAPRDGGKTQVVELLSSKCKALSSNPVPPKKEEPQHKDNSVQSY